MTVVDQGLTRRDWQIALLLALAFVVIAGGTFLTATVCGAYHDDAIYLTTAKALAEGRGYTLIGLPGEPPQTKYPILYPLVLAGLWKVWPSYPANLWLMEGFTLACGAASTGLMFLYLVRFGYCSRRVAIAASALAITTPYYGYLGARVMSELPFALALVVGFWRVEGSLRGKHSSAAGLLLTGVLCALPYLVRSIGVILPVAAIATLVLNRRPWLLVATGAALAAAPWVAWSLSAVGAWQNNAIVGYYTDYVGSWSLIATDPVGIVSFNLVGLFVATAASVIPGTTIAVATLFGATASPFLLPVGAVIWVGFLMQTRHRRLLPIFLVLYGALVVAWPWPVTRFLVPILPLLAALIGGQVSSIARRVLPTLHTPVLAVTFAFLLIMNCVLVAGLFKQMSITRFPTLTVNDRPLQWESFEELFAWIRVHTQTTDRIAAGMDGMVYLHTGRQAFRPFKYRPERLFYGAPGPKSGSAGEILSYLDAFGARYLVVFPLLGFAADLSFSEAIADMRRRFPDRVVPVFIARDPRFMIFEVR